MRNTRRKTGVLRALLALALTGCATTSAPEWAALGEYPYRVGPARVFVMRAADAATTCRGFSHAIQRVAPDAPAGCYLRLGGVPTIITTDSVYVLLHEFRHWLEPEWSHR